MYTHKVTVWCTFWAGGVIGSKHDNPVFMMRIAWYGLDRHMVSTGWYDMSQSG